MAVICCRIGEVIYGLATVIHSQRIALLASIPLVDPSLLSKPISIFSPPASTRQSRRKPTVNKI
ncbi:hypothetical protein [Nostoc sp. C110]|uniref:hypothetical protein n=1 Tax=Nostoc sp. C110 TaxID=3349876 RepID=UPI00370D82F5